MLSKANTEDTLAESFLSENVKGALNFLGIPDSAVGRMVDDVKMLDYSQTGGYWLAVFNKKKDDNISSPSRSPKVSKKLYYNGGCADLPVMEKWKP